MFSPSLSFFAVATLQLVAGHGQSRGPTPRDSVRLVGSVRSAQSSFELFRRSHLPRGDLSSGLCDVWIGRYCYWRGDEEEDADPPAEPESIRQRRASLLRLLDSAAT